MDERMVRPLTCEELPAAFAMVQAVFDEFEAPDYGPEGTRSFQAFLDVEQRGADLLAGRFFAWEIDEENQPVGVAALRGLAHISLLFVRSDRQGRGIGGRLLQELEAFARSHGAQRLTVNASPYGVPIYAHWGFVSQSVEQTVDGIRFTPMAKSLV